MHLFVVLGVKRDQVLFHVATRMAPEPEVVHLQLLRATAYLAPPAVALEHPPMQFAVAHRIESESLAVAADGRRTMQCRWTPTLGTLPRSRSID